MNKLPAIHICLIQPQGYAFSDALLDPAQYFHYQLSRLGASVSLEKNRLRRDAINLVFGAHLGFNADLLQSHSCIIVNLEQIGREGAEVRSAYRRLLRQAVVVDYDRRNPPAYTDHPDDVPVVSFGYAPYLNPAAGQVLPLQQRPVDLLFIGCLNERRLDLIRRIQRSGLKVEALQVETFGCARDSIIRQSKAVLNLHYYESARFEQVRAFVCLSNGTPLLSERHPNSEPGPIFDACVTWFDEKQMMPLFERDFGTPLFYQVMEQQLACFRQVDPIQEYADLLEFVTGVWQAHQSILTLGQGATRVGPDLPAPIVSGPDGRWAGVTWGEALQTHANPPRFQVLADVDWQVEQWLAQGKPDQALLAMTAAISHHFQQPGIIKHALYYPSFDRQLRAMRARLEAELEREDSDAQMAVMTGGAIDSAAPAAVPKREIGACTLLVASELYPIGGHTRLLENLARNVPNPVIYLTDLFGSYHQDPERARWIHERFAGIEVVIGKPLDIWEKIKDLAVFTRARAPAHIWYVHHQQDVVALLGTLAFEPARKMMIHHADHNPSVGCTLPELVHVDITTLLAETCSVHLGKPAQLLPLYVPDHGVRSFPELVALEQVSVVTAGRRGKFTNSGKVALPRIVAAVLRRIGGKFFHIGEYAEQDIKVIKAHLQKQGIDPERYVSLGQVPSVWKCLKTLDAHFYIGSAPFSGGMSAIEAQGCGLPVLPFTGFEAGSLIADYSSYPDLSLGWATVEELAEKLVNAVEHHLALSRKARRFYEERFSEPAFRAAIERICSAR